MRKSQIQGTLSHAGDFSETKRSNDNFCACFCDRQLALEQQIFYQQ